MVLARSVRKDVVLELLLNESLVIGIAEDHKEIFVLHQSLKCGCIQSFGWRTHDEMKFPLHQSS